MTGCFPGTLDVTGIYWLDREAYGRSGGGLRGFRTYLGPFKVRKMDSDVRSGTPTMADVWPDARHVFSWYTRGSPRSALLTRWTKSVSFVRGFLTKDWLRCDDDAEAKLNLAIDSGASFTFAVFPSPDEMGHRFGPTSDEAVSSYLRLDGTIERLFARLDKRGEADSTLVVIASDHGQSNTHTHLSADELVARHIGKTMVYKRFVTPLFGSKAVVLHSGNGMAHVYFKGDGWRKGRPDLSGEPYQSCIDAFLKREEVDILAWREGDGWIRVVSRRGAARIREIDPRTLEYDPSESDPFGYDGIRGKLSYEQWLEATEGHDYPDAPLSIASLLRSRRSGDLIVTSMPGFDLRTWWEYQEPHGTHGALHRKQSMVPVISNALLAEVPMRTVDLYPTMAELMGRDVPAEVEGVSRVS